MKLAPLLLTLTLAATATATAQTFTDPANLRGERVSPSNGHELPIDQGASGLQQLLRKLNTRASVLNIVAHPDDEDGGMLTLYSRGLGARVATLTLNRGEGGQNAMTADFEDALGLIRTQELLSADRYFDVDQMFGTEVDFGFSKTKEESFQKWTHERVLYDAVRAIRLYRPLVIAAVFVGGVTDGHGQHQVSGEIAQEAFKAAADPTVFPDMIAQGILPWQALKVYARVPWADVNTKGVYDYATNQYVPAHFVNYVTGAVTTTLPPDAIDLANTLLTLREPLLARIQSLTGDPALFGQRIRIHSDYHLGQVLRTQSKSQPDFLLIDFEGEPARPLAERRRKQSPLRDVAGMLRSFSYAAQSALNTAIQRSPAHAANLHAWAAAWEAAVSNAFLTTYRSTLSTHPTLLPQPPQNLEASPATQDNQYPAMLQAFLLEKACYELLYELNNRPAWLVIPLTGLLTLARNGA